MVIRAYHRDRGQTAAQRRADPLVGARHQSGQRGDGRACRWSSSACDAHGNIDVADLRAKAEQHTDTLAALMITYPSTHGVFEDAIQEICAIVHEHGGQVYMDGANMNAQVGLTSPAAHRRRRVPPEPAQDVRHPARRRRPGHGPDRRGGAPGAVPAGPPCSCGPAASKAIHAGRGRAVGQRRASCSSPTATSRMLGGDGHDRRDAGTRSSTPTTSRRGSSRTTRCSTRTPSGRVAHEMIFDLRGFKAAGVEEGDVAKRLMDYGFHAPTVSFPVPGTLMVEPTESEPKDELDRFCDALIAIRAGDPGRRRRQGRSEGQRAEERAAHGGGRDGRRPGRTRTRASRRRSRCRSCAPNKFWPSVGADRQPVRRPQPGVRVPADGRVRNRRRRAGLALVRPRPGP